MKKTIRYLLLAMIVCGLTSCLFNGNRKSDKVEKPSKYKYAIIRYDINNVAGWTAYSIGGYAPDQFRPIGRKMREITTSDTVFITDLENIINKRHFKLRGGSAFDTWMMVMLYRNEGEIIDTLAICDEYGWFNGEVFRETKLLGIVGNKIFEHDTEWKRTIMKERFYVDGKWRTHHDVFWEILTDEFTNNAEMQVSTRQND